MKKNKKKHILVLASTFPASTNDPVPAFVRDQIIALKKEYSNLTFSVLAPHDTRSKTKDFTAHADFSEYRFRYAWPHTIEKLAGRGIMPQLKQNPLYYFLIPGLFLSELIATKRLIRTLKPDYIYAHWFTPQGVVACIAARSKIPVVLTTHAADVAVWGKIPLGGFIVRRYINKTRAITAVSRRTQEKLQNFFNHEQWQQVANKSAIIPMGITTKSHSSAAKKQNQHIVFVGRLAEKKGVHHLLAAFALIEKSYPKARLTIAGDGPMFDSLKQQANQLNIAPKITFSGWIDTSQKDKLLNTADIYVVPSIITKSGDAEGLPVSLMEGMSTGAVCIATNESGADGIITNTKDGFLVPQKDDEALAAALETALTLKQDERANIRSEAIKTAQQFSWDSIARQHYDFLFRE